MRVISKHRMACVIFAIVTGLFGVFHLFYAENLAKKVPDFMPGGIIWVHISAAAFILFSLSILLDKFTKFSCYALAVMLFIFIITVHVPIALTTTDEFVKQETLLMMIKDIGLVMAALLVGYNSDRPDNAPNL
jgi:putative oxidoreductase